jgi:hypothetical protein
LQYNLSARHSLVPVIEENSHPKKIRTKASPKRYCKLKSHEMSEDVSSVAILRRAIRSSFAKVLPWHHIRQCLDLLFSLIVSEERHPSVLVVSHKMRDLS